MALGKLFRTTVFKISLAYLVISAIGAGLVLGTVGWNMKNVIDEQIAQTIDTNITGLSEQYAQGGIRRLVNIIQRRTRRPGAGLYLVTTAAGEPIAGNIASLPPAILANPGLVETAYQPPGDATGKHRALVRVFMLEGGFRLLVGHDLEEGERLRDILGGALLTSLFWLIADWHAWRALGCPAGSQSRRCHQRQCEGDCCGRSLRPAEFGRHGRRTRPARAEFQCHARADIDFDGGIEGGFRQYRA